MFDQLVQFFQVVYGYKEGKVDLQDFTLSIIDLNSVWSWFLLIRLDSPTDENFVWKISK